MPANLTPSDSPDPAAGWGVPDGVAPHPGGSPAERPGEGGEDHTDRRLATDLTTDEFDELVSEGLDLIPTRLTDQIDNAVILVEDEPTEEQGDENLLGLYEGTPLTERDSWWAAGSLPDRITIFRGPIIRYCDYADEVAEEVAITVAHEIAHHFGIDDDRLEELGWG
ncbi:hypothetical protein GCG21_16000 [Pseudactinotalea sp. HY160]|uniref:metallopeptidase family protein n=1 Tax=Pseudactinotalea sp. HY160 TaxID=2654490 RepID=UPI00128CC009|nr:hypothetical protein [Pseudactinotalea sp. HY160]